MNNHAIPLFRTIFMSLLIAASISPTACAVEVESSQDGGATATAKGYRATIAPDGCMPELKIGGVSFIEPGVAKFTRGVYLYAGNKVVKMEDISVKGTTVLVKGESASIQYSFSDTGIDFEINNSSAENLNFFMVFDLAVNSIMTADGKSLPAPVGNAGLENVEFVSGENHLKLITTAKLWPFEGRQVAQIDVPAGETRRIESEIKIAGKPGSPNSKLEQLSSPPDKEPVTTEMTAEERTILSPGDYQVFQRTTKDRGSIHIKARTDGTPDAVEYRLIGTSVDGPLPDDWIPVEFDRTSGWVDAKLEAPAGGWYRFELRARKGGIVEPLGTVAHVGIGEVFIGAGQSNSTSCGEFRTNQKSGMVSNYTGEAWRLADDPQLGSADAGKKGCDGGSYYPAFGDAMYEKYGVPIGVTPTGHTATSVRYWQPGGDLYKGLLKRMQALGEHGFRAVLWHQGETDVDLKLTKEEYFRLLEKVIENSRKDMGWDVPWIVAQVSFPGRPKDNAIRVAQAELWRDGIALEGPDTDQLVGSSRDKTGVHFSPKGLEEHGHLWAERVQAWLESNQDL